MAPPRPRRRAQRAACPSGVPSRSAPAHAAGRRRESRTRDRGTASAAAIEAQERRAARRPPAAVVGAPVVRSFELQFEENANELLSNAP